jgi:hypothetical protein
MASEPRQREIRYLDGFIDDDLIFAILGEVGLPHPGKERFDNLARALELLHVKFAVLQGADKIELKHNHARTDEPDDKTYFNGETRIVKRSLPARQLRAMQGAAIKIKKFINEQNFPLVKDALQAASLHLHLRNKFDPDQFINVECLFQDLDDRCRQLNQLINHLSEVKRDYSLLTKTKQENWLFDVQSKAELQIRQLVYPFMQKSEAIQKEDGKQHKSLGDDDDRRGWDMQIDASANVGYHKEPLHFLMSSIAALYTQLYDKPFSVVPRTEKPNYEPGTVRFLGPGVRFAAAVVHHLRLGRFFFADGTMLSIERDNLIDKVGGMWEYMAKRADKEVT